MRESIDAAFVMDDNYYIEGVATAYAKLGLSCCWWEPSKKPFFDLKDEMNPKVVYYSPKGLANNWVYMRGADTHLNLRNVEEEYPEIMVNDLLYEPGNFDKYLASDALMVIKTQINEKQVVELFKLAAMMPKMKIISKKYIPIINLVGECTKEEIRDAIASTKAIVDYDKTFAGVAFYYDIPCINLTGEILTPVFKPKTFLEAVTAHVGNSDKQP